MTKSIFLIAEKSRKHGSLLPQQPHCCLPRGHPPALLRKHALVAVQPARYSSAAFLRRVALALQPSFQAARCTDTESPSENFGAGRAAQKPVQEKRSVRCRRRTFLKQGGGCHLHGTALPPAGRETRNNAPYCCSFDLRSYLVNSTQVLQVETACGNVGNARVIGRNLPRSLPRPAARSASRPE